jgi:hypothetical protein
VFIGTPRKVGVRIGWTKKLSGVDEEHREGFDMLSGLG